MTPLLKIKELLVYDLSMPLYFVYYLTLVILNDSSSL
jgi:hypothetical protein